MRKPNADWPPGSGDLGSVKQADSNAMTSQEWGVDLLVSYCQKPIPRSERNAKSVTASEYAAAVAMRCRAC